MLPKDPNILFSVNVHGDAVIAALAVRHLSENAAVRALQAYGAAAPVQDLVETDQIVYCGEFHCIYPSLSEKTV